MNIKLVSICALLSVLGLGTLLAGSSDSKPGLGLDALDDFVGTWMMADENGEATDMVATEVRKTAGGSALLEILMPGTPNEMITMYYMDGDQLKLTHYCSCTNHPILAASRDGDGNLRFDCTGKGENFAECKTTPHMHDAVYRFDGKDKVSTTWRMMEDGELGYEANFSFIRKTEVADARDAALDALGAGR